MPRFSDGRITIETIGDMIERGYAISVYCESRGPGGYPCRNSARIDLPALAMRLGQDHLSLAKDLKPHFRCSKCGSKEMTFRLHPPAPPAPDRVSVPAPRAVRLPEGPSYREQKRARRKRPK